jgi:GNAT superfamily N-acetyltransferase
LIERRASDSDGRQSLLRLTRKGRETFAELDRRTHDDIAQSLAALAPTEQRRLVDAMRTIESLLGERPATGVPYVLRTTPQPGDMGWVVERHGALYAQEYGWNDRMEALIARVVADFIEQFDARRERCWIAERDGESLGCIFLVKHPEQADIAKLRLLLVEPSARGLGLGKALVNDCVTFARRAGYKKVTLWTQSILTGAHHIYQQAGFRLVHEAQHHSFGVALTGQTWDLKW